MVSVFLTFFLSLALWGFLFLIHRSMIKQSYKQRSLVAFQNQQVRARHSLIPYVCGFLFVPMIVLIVMVYAFNDADFISKLGSGDIQTIFIFVFLSLSVLIYFIRNSKRLRW